jgi:hypothetical protein
MNMYRIEGIMVKYEWWCENRTREKEHKKRKKEMKEDTHGLPELNCCWK